ncbi:LysM peptidoglycan-binding domain-containing protein [Spirochaeta cellobiosiphila]|uniref:LysM peptidoglycan-binding domain-containing protein n=1 Tax=Spirochaeta cellobiosiphila TaxID=504483 RepID=UPI0003F9D0D8|nr:LysM peptidoglycan-binding domain-containing protein [Spirochaeta cellobiosiphila]
MNHYKYLLGCALFLFIISIAYSEEYVVQQGDTLSEIAYRYSISQDRIMAINHFDEDILRDGIRILIPNSQKDTKYIIQEGDTLSSISYAFDISQEELRRGNPNALYDDILQVGKEIRLSSQDDEYEVRAGDTLSGLAYKWDISMDKIQRANHLDSPFLRVGMKLKIPQVAKDIYVVQAGDSLWSIAHRHNVSMATLRLWNDLSSDTLYVGQKLKLTYSSPRDSIKPLGEYYYSKPHSDHQLSISYQESPSQSLQDDYEQASSLIRKFQKSIAAERSLGRELEGWHIILDPGHGGYDSGAIVEGSNGMGQPIYIVEDEYAYDTSLRLYRLLALHGAQVDMTIISPNHIIRDGSAHKPFTHEKNEVYNWLGGPNNTSFRPRGGTKGLEERKILAKKYLSQSHSRHTLYISMHADNSPNLPEATAIIYYGDNSKELKTSLSFAQTLTEYLGQGAFTHKEEVRVLRNNPADAAVLIETRNLYFDRNGWAIRDWHLREEQASMILNGVLAYAARSSS